MERVGKEGAFRREGRQASGSVTVTSKAHESQSKALSDAAYSLLAKGLTLTGMFLHIHLHDLACSTWPATNREWRLPHLGQAWLQETEALCNMMPVSEEYKERQREPRNCLDLMPKPAVE